MPTVHVAEALAAAAGIGGISQIQDDVRDAAALC